MFGSKNSGQLRWYLAALGFVWATVIAGIASAGETQVTICHFPPGNRANYQQITVGAAAVPAHLAHGDFVGTCASDCNVNTTLCNRPPDGCHQAGSCVTSTGLCEFPLQPDFTACTGSVGSSGYSCDYCVRGACIGASSCNPDLSPSCTDLACTNGTCQNEPLNCPASTSSCYAIACEPTLDSCIETCNATVCGDGSPTLCGQAVGCVTDADCASSNPCQQGTCQNSVCVFGKNCQSGNPSVEGFCDAKQGCVDVPNTGCNEYENTNTFAVTLTDSLGFQFTIQPDDVAFICPEVTLPAGVQQIFPVLPTPTPTAMPTPCTGGSCCLYSNCST